MFLSTYDTIHSFFFFLCSVKMFTFDSFSIGFTDPCFEPACGERDILVTMTARCMCVRGCVRICPDHKIVDGFLNNLTQMIFTCRCTVWNIRSGGPKVKFTLEGQIFVRTTTPTILAGFQYKHAQL